MLSDIEIARSVKLRPINEVAEELGLKEEQIENYGRYIAKVETGAIDKSKFAGHHHSHQSYQGWQWQDYRECRFGTRYAADRQEGCCRSA